jgi:hypothetical protein
MARTRTATVVLVALLTAVALPLYVAAAGAKPKTKTQTLKLTAATVKKELVGNNGPALLVSLLEGSRKVGGLVVTSANCSLNLCYQGERGNLKVGLVRGKAKLHLAFKAHGIPPRPAKYGYGTLSTKHRSESIRVPGTGFPSTVGGRCTIVLTWKTKTG